MHARSTAATTSWWAPSDRAPDKEIALCGQGYSSDKWRRGRDSNPRAGYPARRFRGAPVHVPLVPLYARWGPFRFPTSLAPAVAAAPRSAWVPRDSAPPRVAAAGALSTLGGAPSVSPPRCAPTVAAAPRSAWVPRDSAPPRACGRRRPFYARWGPFQIPHLAARPRSLRPHAPRGSPRDSAPPRACGRRRPFLRSVGPLASRRSSVVGRRSSVVGRRSSVVDHRRIGHRPPVIGHRPPVIGHRPPVIGHRPPVIGHRPSAIGHRLSAALRSARSAASSPGTPQRARRR